jgi:deazaflavin-dependent oxidoreductase (nitroreductase family)
MADWDPEAFTRQLIADMRAHGGVPSEGYFKGRKLLILTTTGAKSGQQRTAVVAYRDEGGAWIIAASKSGADENPGWYFNLEADPHATVEVNNETFPVIATLEASGAERDRLWDAHVAEMPGFGEYPSKTDRVIPMIRLAKVAAPAATR